MDTIPELDSSDNTSNDIINISGEATNNNDNNNAATSTSPLSSSSRSSRYENQKRRDWNTFGQYLKNHRPPLSLSRCSGAYVLEFLRYLDQFEKTKAHTPICPFYGQPSPPAPCPCPICGLDGDNLIERSTNLNWYKGQTLLQALDQIQEPNRHSDKPLRLPLEGVKIGSNGTVAVGRIETGILKPGMKVTLGPIGLTAKVKSVEMNHHESVQEALPGDTVSIHIKKKKKKKKIDVKCGYVASNSKDDPAKEAVSFICQLVILNRPTACLISNGYTAMLHCHTFHGVVKFEEIMSKTDLMKSGHEDDHQEHVEEEPNFLEKGDVGIVKMVPMKPMVVEAFEEYPPLGHFTITDMEQIVGVGVIKSVEKKEYCDGGNKGIKSAVIKTGKRLGAAVGHALFVAIFQLVVAALS